MSARDVIADWLDDYIGYRSASELKSDADAILAALEAAGYAVVPKEPTEAMLNSGWRERGQQHSMTAVYKAMLAAAKETT